MKRKKNKKNQGKRHYFLFFLLAFFTSFALISTAFLLKKKSNNSSQHISNIEVEHFDKTRLTNFFDNLTEKYPFLEGTSKIEDCNRLNTTKERILCKEFFKQKQREILMYKPYLVFALVKYGVISAEEAIYKYQIPKEKLAEALDDSSLCFNDTDCLEVYKSFKETYKDRAPLEYGINKAWEYYKKGLLSLENYTNPYNTSYSNEGGSCGLKITKS